MQFGRYRVTRTLGSGAMGDVYEAVDDVLGREVAIKTLKSANGAILLDERFRLEARAIAQLSHPGVVQVFDIDLAVDPPYLVMERVAGPSLSERITSAPLAADELVPLGIQIARALAAAHAAGIVHRDVKPANVLSAGPGSWKLADFGVAHVPDSSLTITGQFVGSPAYAPPEALVKGLVSPAGDIYALGATLYEAAAGRWPRRDAGGAILAPVPPLAELAPHIPAAIAAAIDRAVALEPTQRPTAAELADLLAHPSQIMPAAAPAISGAMPAASPHRRRTWWPLAIAAAALLLLAIILGSGSHSSSDNPGNPVTPAFAPTPTAPPTDDPRAADDWNKIVDDVRRGHYGPARHKLDEWESRYGETDESRTLRDQLPEESGPPGKRKHKHGD